MVRSITALALLMPATGGAGEEPTDGTDVSCTAYRSILIYVLSDGSDDDTWRDWYEGPSHLDPIVSDLQSAGFVVEVVDRASSVSLPIDRLREFSQVWIVEGDVDADVETAVDEVQALVDFSAQGGGVWLCLEGTLHHGTHDWKEDVLPYAQAFGCGWRGDSYDRQPRPIPPSAHPLLEGIRSLRFDSEVGMLAASRPELSVLWVYADSGAGIVVRDSVGTGSGPVLIDAGWLLGWAWCRPGSDEGLRHGNRRFILNAAEWLEPRHGL